MQKYVWLRTFQKAAAKPLLMVFNVEELAIKPGTYFCEKMLVMKSLYAAVNPLWIVSNFQETDAKLFQTFPLK